MRFLEGRYKASVRALEGFFQVSIGSKTLNIFEELPVTICHWHSGMARRTLRPQRKLRLLKNFVRAKARALYAADLMHYAIQLSCGRLERT